MFSLVKIFFFHAALWPQTSMAAGRNLPSDKLSWNDKAADDRPRGCAVVPASIMPRGFFASLPIDQGRFAGKRENRRNQSHSSRRPDSFPAQAPMPLHMAESGPKCKGLHVAVQQK
ncbi:hypothetical protein FJW07_26615 [Mesorhizobium sp. B3-1-9]|uniref:hypothetical protein n=1 Tax=unclassified Mesorhizobium TaxID=325217 RepID=UPI00112B446D|nr:MULTISPECIES: hypothetical protein [unclassified Mesorhizobium]TPI32772.1 hypothetical protein FJW07_26615 [Mesorhizobium sp. B3-1-9]TPI33187.1 hypothetical protein FJ414_21055 [Mesorhizobium sp. B3-1-6]TPI55979.1 hypothetical protein FJ417_22880 [Mesorhizobium sp. B3-1-7]TPJ30497.1 hypothetical protein FJ418_23340 [Mesorhizobium sp. B2-8-3]UCI24119.1 hypothetical protein FJ430_21255 [Mesorhizobium sp. B2-8-5]